MADGALSLYNNFDSFQRIQELVINGQPETVYLECKSPQEARLTPDLQAHLAKVAGAFANTAGGVFLYGIETQRHKTKNLDVIKQINFVGNAEDFKHQIEAFLPSLTIPPILAYKIKIIRENETDSKGIIVLYIPQMLTNPLMNNNDREFYYRVLDRCEKMPYDMIKRLFSATESPDLFINLMNNNVSEGYAIFGITIYNNSSAIGEHSCVHIEILNSNEFDSVQVTNFQDESSLNDGRSVWTLKMRDIVHKGLNISLGKLKIKPKTEQGHKTILLANIRIFANKMIMKIAHVRVQVEPAQKVDITLL